MTFQLGLGMNGTSQSAGIGFALASVVDTSRFLCQASSTIQMLQAVVIWPENWARDSLILLSVVVTWLAVGSATFSDDH